MTASVNRDVTGLHGPLDFEDFYTGTVRITVSHARRVAGRREVADDAAQDAYLAMMADWPKRRWRSLDDNTAFVRRCAVNRAIDWLRKNARLTDFDAIDIPVEDCGFEAILDGESLARLVRTHIDSLPDARRVIAYLFFFEELKAQEIAWQLGIDQSTVRTQIQRVRTSLKPLALNYRTTGSGGGPE
jgi:RNA polymerase sigma-70 factor, ECF subfamily